MQLLFFFCISTDGDLNPNNVLLKSDSTSRKNFVCKLAVGTKHLASMIWSLSS